MAYVGRYAADGSWNVAVVDGSVYTGATSVDGAVNVFQSVAAGPIGLYAPCGAYNVTVAGTPVLAFNPRQAPNGSLNISVSPYTNGGQRVTVVSGVLV